MKQACVSIDLHPLQTATGRTAFEYVATQVQIRQFLNAMFGPALHPVRMIDPCLRRNEANSSVIGHEPKRLARYTQSDLEFGTNWYPLDITAEHVGKKGVTLVPSVKADPFAKQAGGDTNPNTLQFLRFVRRTRAQASA
jgi:hypothetical protein